MVMTAARRKHVSADQTEDPVAKALRTPPPPDEAPWGPTDLLGSGSTLVNLAASGLPNGAFAKGKYSYLVGDSSSGKTFWTMTALAEAARSKHFAGYRFIYDDVEDGALMDKCRFFGQAMVDRLEPPRRENGIPIFSANVDEFYFHFDDAVRQGQPFIYICDSTDALLGNKQDKKFAERKSAARKSTDALSKVKGDYGDGKAKRHSEELRSAINKLRSSGSILLLVSQTRDNIDEFSFETKTRAGGRALKFYATFEMWTSIVGRITREVRGVTLQTGIRTKVQIKKNRLTGKEWSVEVPIYHSYGIDDIGSQIDFLAMTKHWKAVKGVITAPDMDFEGTIPKLVTHIENNDLQRDLRGITTEVWQSMEEAAALHRKPRYE